MDAMETPRPARPDVPAQTLHWEGGGSSRIPFAAYTDEALHRRELERFFYRGHWCYVGLEAEIPNPGDFKRTAVGERSVILTRAVDGSVHVVENVCAHRGMAFCRERHGNRKEFVCPYHQWNYTLKGDLQGVPFRRGVKQDGKVHGGMPADFKTEDNGLNKLNFSKFDDAFAAFAKLNTGFLDPSVSCGVFYANQSLSSFGLPTFDGHSHLGTLAIVGPILTELSVPVLLAFGRTRRAGVLDALEPDPVALVHPLDLDALGGRPGDVITIASRRGEVALYARADDGTPRGAVFVPFCYYEAAINRLRESSGSRELVRTVVKRGYALSMAR